MFYSGNFKKKWSEHVKNYFIDTKTQRSSLLHLYILDLYHIAKDTFNDAVYMYLCCMYN